MSRAGVTESEAAVVDVTIEIHEYLIGLACGHYWPGSVESDDDAKRVFALLAATGDSAHCPACGGQRDITGPLVKVIAK